MSHDQKGNGSKFDNFLHFLDDAAVDRGDDAGGAISPLTQHTGESSKFVDLMSFLAESESNTKGRREHHRSAAASAHGSTYSASRRQGRGNDDNYDDGEQSAAIQASLADIKTKVNAMKVELQEKNNQIKALQVQYQQIRAARDKRLEKVRNSWEKQLRDAREEFASTIKNSEEVRDSAKNEVSHFEVRVKQLQGRLEGSKTAKEEVIRAMTENAEAQLKRARRQLEEDEARRVEKEVASKLESMKRAAREALAPDLEKAVAANRQKIQARGAEAEIEYTKTKRLLQLDYDKKLAEARETMREYAQSHEMRLKEGAEGRISETTRRHEEEVEDCKQKYRRLTAGVEENGERTLRKEGEKHAAVLVKLRDTESARLEELVQGQQKELTDAAAQCSADQADRVAKIERLLKQHEADCSVKVEREREAQEDAARTSLRARYGAETEKILLRVRDEIQSERSRTREGMETELDDLRLKQQVAMNDLQKAEEKATHRLRTLREEYDVLKREKNDLEASQRTLRSDKSELLMSVQRLRANLRNVEDEEATKQLESNLTVERRLKDNEAALSEWRERLAEAEEEAQAVEGEYSLKRSKLKLRLQEESGRIKDKITQVLRKKDSALDELRDKVADFKAQNAKLQEMVDDRRRKTLSLYDM